MKTLRNTLLGLLATLALIALPSIALAQGSGNYSGDDTYDLAAADLPEGTPMRIVNRFSGDDAYDPAAGGLHYYESAYRYVLNFSGDDAYDLDFDWMPDDVTVAQVTSR